MVQDAGYEFGEFLVLAVAVDGECVGGDGCVDYKVFPPLVIAILHANFSPLGVVWKTYPSVQQSG